MINRFFHFLVWLHGGDKTVDHVCEEWHAWWNGFAEMVCLRIPPVAPMSEHALKEIDNEWHYYAWGRGTAVITYVIIILVLI